MAAVLKTAMGNTHRGFESHALRSPRPLSADRTRVETVAGRTRLSRPISRTGRRAGVVLPLLAASALLLPLLAGCGAAPVAMPSLVGERLDHATTMLAKAGLDSVEASDTVGRKVIVDD